MLDLIVRTTVARTKKKSVMFYVTKRSVPTRGAFFLGSTGINSIYAS